MSRRNTDDLFAALDPVPLHDPGGKVATMLPRGMEGNAEFSGDRQEYRPWLMRTWGETTEQRFILWIGLNPSTARADVNDPTITREVDFSKRWGFSKYIKTNIMDYRATEPAGLLADGVIPRSAENLPTILRFAANADQIVVCHGVPPHKRLHTYAIETFEVLRNAGHINRMCCFGTTLFGWPRHPLYLSKDTPLQPYHGPEGR